MTKIVPMPGFVLVTPITEERSGAFSIQEVNMEKQQKGKVVGVGKAVLNEWGTLMETEVEVGDIVYHRSWGHEVINIEGAEFRVVKFLDICLKLEE